MEAYLLFEEMEDWARRRTGVILTNTIFFKEICVIDNFWQLGRFQGKQLSWGGRGEGRVCFLEIHTERDYHTLGSWEHETIDKKFLQLGEAKVENRRNQSQAECEVNFSSQSPIVRNLVLHNGLHQMM